MEKEKLLFEKTKEQLSEKIVSLPDNSFIGSERELATAFEVSRQTIRRALEILKEEGVVYKIPYKGYFKKQKDDRYTDYELNTFVGLFEDAERQNKEVYSKVIQQTIIEGDKNITDKLQTEEGTELFVLERLRYIENKPMCLVKTYIILENKSNLLEADFSQESLYKKLKEDNVHLVKANRAIEVRTPTVKDMHMLGLSSHEPVIALESLVFTKNDNPFEYTVSNYPAYQVKFATEVSF